MQTQATLAQAGDNIMALLHGTLRILVDDPHLRRYFYDGAEPPQGESGAKVATVAEMLADCIDSGCETASAMRLASGRLDGWEAYGVFLLDHSPVVRALVEAQPDWYPKYGQLRPTVIQPDAEEL